MKHKACILLLAIMMSMTGPAFAEPPIRINTSIKPPFSTSNETGFFDLLVKELGKRLGQAVELVRLPPERALYSLNNGLSDAELPRIAGLETTYPNIIRVDEPLLDYNFVAFIRGTSSDVCGEWDDLSGHRVGYLVGWKIFEANVPRQASVSKLTKPPLLFRMLEEGRIEAALYERYAGRDQIAKGGFPDLNECPTPLAVRPMYMYLNKGHAELVPRVSEVLRQMKADGTYDRIVKETLEK